jgi:hypothetical protein
MMDWHSPSKVKYLTFNYRLPDIFDNIDNYRARFLSVPMKLILTEIKEKSA